MDLNGEPTFNNRPLPNAPNNQGRVMHVNEESNEIYIHESDIQPNDIIFSVYRDVAPNAFQLLFQERVNYIRNQMVPTLHHRERRHFRQELIRFVTDNGGRFLRRLRPHSNVGSNYVELTDTDTRRYVTRLLREDRHRRRTVANPQEAAVVNGD
jgi:hypothetical protein